MSVSYEVRSGDSYSSNNSSQHVLDDGNRSRSQRTARRARQPQQQQQQQQQQHQQQQQQQEPQATEHTASLMELVEAQILSRLETPAGRQVLLEEAAFYGNDVDAARAAIVHCAREKVRRRLTSACNDREADKLPSPGSPRMIVDTEDDDDDDDDLHRGSRTNSTNSRNSSVGTDSSRSLGAGGSIDRRPSENRGGSYSSCLLYTSPSPRDRG